MGCKSTLCTFKPLMNPLCQHLQSITRSVLPSSLSCPTQLTPSLEANCGGVVRPHPAGGSGAAGRLRGIRYSRNVSQFLDGLWGRTPRLHRKHMWVEHLVRESRYKGATEWRHLHTRCRTATCNRVVKHRRKPQQSTDQPLPRHGYQCQHSSSHHSLGLRAGW